MNDSELVKNILLGKTCETCEYLKIMNNLVLCVKGPNDKKTILTDSCKKWVKKINPLDLSDINKLLDELEKSMGIPKGYIDGRK